VSASASTYLRYLLFSRYAAHPCLHSFPTRRSSDLRRHDDERAPFLQGERKGRDEGLARAGGEDDDAAAPRLEPRLDRLALMRERSEEHTSELQSRGHLVCRLLLEKKKKRRVSDS